MDADAVELRVLGSLLEKQRTTPDVYPLSLNALRLACNQSTSREPVMDLDEPAVRTALERLSRRGWVRLASGPGSRAAKYRHLLDEALRLAPSELALLAVLMLRGPQTLGELRGRSERLYRFGSLEEPERKLRELAERELAELLPRRPGEREERWRHLLGEGPEPSAAPRPPAPTQDAAPPDRVAVLEERVAELERRFERFLAGQEEPDAGEPRA